MTEFEFALETLSHDRFKAVNVSMPEDIVASYADFPVDRIGVYRGLKDLTSEERNVYDRFNDIINKDDKRLLEVALAGVALPSEDGWLITIYPNSIVRFYGKDESQVVMYKVFMHDEGVGFIELSSEDKVSDVYLGNTVSGYSDSSGFDLVNKIYNDKLRPTIDTKLN